MARLFQMNELEARKRALVAESEVYRQTLTLEVQNLRLYGARARRRFNWFSPSNPLLGLLAPMAGSALKSPAILGALRARLFSRFRLLGTALTVWQLYRRFGPIIRMVLARRSALGRPAVVANHEDEQDISETRI